MHSASIERDRLLLGIPDRRPDVIGQGNLAEKGKPRRTSTLMRRYRFRSPNTMAKESPAFLPLSLLARGILLCTIHSPRLFDVHSTKGRGGRGKNNYRDGESKERVRFEIKPETRFDVKRTISIIEQSLLFLDLERDLYDEKRRFLSSLVERTLFFAYRDRDSYPPRQGNLEI